MNCRDYQLQITLQSYGELDGRERADLDRHLRECADCTFARDEQQSLDLFLAEEEVASVPPELLAESRRSLADALDGIEIRRSWWRMPAFRVVFTPMRLLESAALVAMGLAVGVYVGRTPAVAQGPSANPSLVLSGLSSLPPNSTVNWRMVKSEGGNVELVGESVQPLRRQGSINEMLPLLFGALQDTANPRARLGAVEVLAQQSSLQAVQEGLIYALTHDPEPSVRMKALSILKASAAQESVQRALAYVLRNDEVPGIRAGAIEALTGVSQAEDVVKTIQEAAEEDDNAYVRMKSQAAGMQLVGRKK